VQGLTAGIDYKDIKSTLRASSLVPDDPNSDDPNATKHEETAFIKSPIRYLPFQLTWWSNFTDIDNSVSFSIGDRFNLSGLVSGGSAADFHANRAVDGVNGNYQVFVWNAEYRRRLSMADGASFLANLGQSLTGPLWTHNGLPHDSIGLYDDWALVMRTNGQYATQPLIPTEQYPAGGVGSVRGYLQSEVFGDNAYALTAELFTRRFAAEFHPGYSLGMRPSAFWDYACMNNTAATRDERKWVCIGAVGLGLQYDFTRWITGQLYLADPLESTTSTTAGKPRLHFRLTGGF